MHTSTVSELCPEGWFNRKNADHHVVDGYTCVQTAMTVSRLRQAENVQYESMTGA